MDKEQEQEVAVEEGEEVTPEGELSLKEASEGEEVTLEEELTLHKEPEGAPSSAEKTQLEEEEVTLEEELTLHKEPEGELSSAEKTQPEEEEVTLEEELTLHREPEGALSSAEKTQLEEEEVMLEEELALHKEPEGALSSAEKTQPDKEEKLTGWERAKAIFREHFSAPRLAYMAIFTALAYVVTFLEFPIFPATPFLKLDFANVFFAIEGFIFGPVEAVVSIGIKECLSLIDSQTAGVGELANFIMSVAYIIVPATAYRFLKGRKWVAVFLVIACAVQIGISVLVNRYINYPFFGNLYGFDGVAMFNSTWEFVILFNLIKSVSVGVLVFLVYKPLSKFIKATDLRFQKRMQKVKEGRKAKTN